jgi:hypothetical protein
MPNGLKAALRRWLERRQLRRADARDSRIRARENLRDFKRSGGHEGGAPGNYG